MGNWCFDGVFEETLRNSKIVSGAELWDAFVSQSKTKENGTLRIAVFVIEAGEEKDKMIFDLSCQNGKYAIKYMREDEIVTKEYSVLMEFDGAYYKKEWFLTNQTNVTYEQLQKSRYSSNLETIVDYWLVYFAE